MKLLIISGIKMYRKLPKFLTALMQKGQSVAFLSKALGPVHQSLSIYEKSFWLLSWLLRDGGHIRREKNL
jgi:hypothetical protein